MKKTTTECKCIPNTNHQFEILETGPQIKTKFSKNDIFLKEKAVKSTAVQKFQLI